MQILNSAIFEKPSCKFKFLQREGFNVPNYYELTTIDEVLALYKKYMQSTRDKLEYDIDGLVQEVNDFDAQKQLGWQPNGLNPKFATAIKFDSSSGITTLREIVWSVGTTGRIIPVAIFDPIDIMGVTISKCTLHNYEFLETEINKNGLQIGSQIIIIRANDVIPKYLGVKS